MRRRVRHHHRVGTVESRDEQPALLVDPRIHRPPQPVASLGPRPIRHRGEQRVRDDGIVDTLEESEKRGAVGMHALVLLVDDARDPPDGFAVAESDPQPAPGVCPEWIPRPEHLRDLDPERQHACAFAAGDVDHDPPESVEIPAGSAQFDDADQKSSFGSSGGRTPYFFWRAWTAANGFMPPVQVGSESDAAAAHTPVSRHFWRSQASCRP